MTSQCGLIWTTFQLTLHQLLREKRSDCGAMVWPCLVLLGATGGRYEMPSLMADMHGFASKEEMSDTKDYLRSHGNYKLEQVSGT